MSNYELRQAIAEKIQDKVFEFEGSKILSLIDNFMHADDDLTKHQERMQNQQPGSYGNQNQNLYCNRQESHHYPEQQKHLQGRGQYDYTNPSGSNQNISSNPGKNYYGENEIQHDMSNMNLEHNYGGNNVAMMYAKDFENENSSANHKNSSNTQTSNVDQGNWMPSTPHPEDIDEKNNMKEKSNFTESKMISMSSHKEEINSSKDTYWNDALKIEPKNRYYMMPIKDTVFNYPICFNVNF